MSKPVFERFSHKINCYIRELETLLEELERSIPLLERDDKSARDFALERLKARLASAVAMRDM